MKIKIWAPFTHFVSKINNKQIDNAKDIGVTMLMYSLKEYSDNCSKTLGSIWQYYKYEPALDNNGPIIDRAADNNNSVSFKFV